MRTHADAGPGTRPEAGAGTARASFLRAVAASPAPPAVLLVDLDRFADVNDTAGTPAGDAVLTETLRRLRACLRPGDTATRLGADEFAALLPGADRTEAETIAARVLAALRAPFDTGGTPTHLTATAGIATAGDPDTLLRHAGLALRHAKRTGRDHAATFHPALQAALDERVTLEADLRRALDTAEFTVHYQPIVRLGTGDVTGVEALVRWQHPTRGLVPPLDFIPIAEDTGLIVRLGEWVLREACTQAAAWNRRRPAHLPPLTVSVNLSARQLDRPDLPATVASALADAGLDPAGLTLELTESLLIGNTDATVRRLHDLKRLGVRLAVDDFGTGYSSLAYLRSFPVDVIKIDKSFVDELGHGPAASALTMAIVQLGQSLHLTTVAEGVEQAAQRSELVDGNCEYGQGYLFARPLTPAAVEQLLFPA
ncbi:putative bifunctional diguanylate cyclase/phosphodiesterase [Spirilliplanes yamanashiensis]|uniref:Diguanylate cyclase/phosphodiesterase n=1 Tax=Spirilliplanes yamanashiensis TaxID=42233 RepID=A0A8J3YD24_9ACTN|nr:bifunctional diguanylate cyclase/phosphodiesterase [Spirilliplanes yamanashiensis]MDP9815191.1 diguanylate cyclase (GGDEF)-like protein [Spirilliplanes yamanashiensis]GIJ06541.1 hypothetical protein Sya03_58930 [Spirilliplanes yamanashiensis]